MVLYVQKNKQNYNKKGIIMFNMFKKSVSETEEATSSLSQTLPQEDEKQEEYIWVEGYKGTDSEMKGYKGFQYEIGKEYTCDGEPVICKNGFHFCLELEDVFSYFELWNNNSRFFKVKALVKKSDFESCGKFYFMGGKIDKIAAKTIKLEYELTNAELRDNIKLDSLISLEEFIEIRNIGNLRLGLIKIAKERLSGKYSDTFISVLCDEKIMDFASFKKIVNTAIALHDEDVSADMRAFLLMRG